MWSRLKASVRRRVPAIRRRDEKIHAQQVSLDEKRSSIRSLRRKLRDSRDERKTLQRKVTELESSISETAARTAARAKAEARSQRISDQNPSFRRQILGLRNYTKALASEDTSGETALRQLPHKLRNYQLATTHGIRCPHVYRTWDSAEHIEFNDLPDEFVFKSDGGAGGQGVFPLKRIGPDLYRTAGDRTTYSLESIKKYILARPRAIRPPYFAEEFLRVEGHDGPIPPDVKVFAFYGEVGQILLRSVGAHGDPDTVRYRFISSDGSDLGKVSLSPLAPISSDVPQPAQLDRIVEVARHLSLSTGTPFVRVDLYDTAGQPTFGEFTRAPGGTHRYTVDHDRFMGQMWLRAQARLERDLMRGRPPGALYGEESAPSFYGGMQRVKGPEVWPITVRSCSEWCKLD